MAEEVPSKSAAIEKNAGSLLITCASREQKQPGEREGGEENEKVGGKELVGGERRRLSEEKETLRGR